jgi:hypothetical protein
MPTSPPDLPLRISPTRAWETREDRAALTSKLLDDQDGTLLVGQPVSIEVTQAER